MTLNCARCLRPTDSHDLQPHGLCRLCERAIGRVTLLLILAALFMGAVGMRLLGVLP